jgi:hypothetical protein
MALCTEPTLGSKIGRVPPISDTAIESLLKLVMENTSSPKIGNKKGGIQAELSLVLMTVASGMYMYMYIYIYIYIYKYV